MIEVNLANPKITKVPVLEFPWHRLYLPIITFHDSPAGRTLHWVRIYLSKYEENRTRKVQDWQISARQL